MTKEWVKATTSPSGTYVTVTLQDGAVTARFTEKTFRREIAKTVPIARRGARQILDDIKGAM